MTWETIEPRRGQRVTVSRGVTVSWRKSSAAAAFSMNVTIAGPLAEQLGWAKKQRVQVQRDMAAGLLRLSRADGPTTFALNGAASGAVLAVTFGFGGLDLNKPERSAPAPHRIEGGALILELPAWARASAPQRTVSPPPAKPTAPSREETALSLLRARVGTDQVVRETGLPPREVVRLAEQVKGERARAAA